MMTIRSNFSARHAVGWTSSLPSCTIPVQGKTIRELHQKYTRGTIASNVTYKPYYDTDTAPFDAPLTPDRLHATDPVDVEIAHNVINDYIDDIKESANRKMDEFKQKSKQEFKQKSKQESKQNSESLSDSEESKIE